MISTDVNYLAVVVGAVINMALGAFWYSNAGFGKTWAALSGLGNLSPSQMEEMKKKGNKSMGFMALTALVMTFILANVIDWAEASTLSEGAQVGFGVWLGFLATSMLGIVLWDNKPFKLYVINTSYYLVTLVVVGAMLAVWA